MLRLRDAVAKPSSAYHGGFYMPRLFYPPLVEPGVYVKPKGIQIKAPQRNPLRCFLSATLVCKPGSVLTAIYLAPRLLAGSSHLLGAVGSTFMLLHGVAPDRVYIVKPMSPWAGCALTAPFHPGRAAKPSGGISLLHLSWGHPRRALPVILTLWSPDFPHLGPFGAHPRLSNLVAGLLYSIAGEKSNVLKNLSNVYILQV